MLSRRTSKKKKPLQLQLTSLLDMFTIILVFLMVSYQADDEEVVLHAGLELPPSTAQSSLKAAVDVALSQDAVLVEGKPVYALAPGGKVQPKDVERRSLDALVAAVGKIRDQNPDEASDVVMLQADKGVPYATIHTVMRSAAQAGLSRFRLVVERK